MNTLSIDLPILDDYSTPRVPKPNPKPKLNLTIREESRRKLEHLSKVENRSMSNLIEKMADDWWERLCAREGESTAFVENLARLLNMKSDTPEARKEVRRVVMDRVLER